MKDKIFMEKLAFYGYHGVYPEENRIGQKFYVDIDLYGDFQKAGLTDDLNETIDYGKVYTLVREQVENFQYQLIETLAEKICRILFQHFARLDQVRIKIYKPDPPIKGYYDCFGVEIFRDRKKGELNAKS